VRHVEVVVIGGGFAGLSAALHLKLARPHLDVLLVEAGRVGAGASGRNTGLLGPGVGGSIVELRAKLGAEGARRAYEATLDAVRRVATLIDEEKLACGFERSGQLLVARSVAQLRRLEAQARAFEALGFSVPLLAKDEIPLPTTAFHGALRFDEAGVRSRLDTVGAWPT